MYHSFHSHFILELQTYRKLYLPSLCPRSIHLGFLNIQYIPITYFILSHIQVVPEPLTFFIKLGCTINCNNTHINPWRLDFNSHPNSATTLYHTSSSKTSTPFVPLSFSCIHAQVRERLTFLLSEAPTSSSSTLFPILSVSGLMSDL